MNYREIQNELENLEIKDLSSALKEKLLSRMTSLLKDTNKENTHKIDFVYDDDLEDAIYNIEFKVDNLIEEFEEQCIRVVKIERNKDKSMER